MTRDAEQIKREIEEIRADLSVTVDELSRRASPKALAGQAGSGIKQFFGIGAHIRWERVAAAGAVVIVLTWRRTHRKDRGGAR